MLPTALDHMLACALLASLGAPKCAAVKSEIFANALVRMLMKEGSLPDGAILDVGANDGTWTCMYAEMDANRTVVAVEPYHANVLAIKQMRRDDRANIEVHQGVIAARPAEYAMPTDHKTQVRNRQAGAQMQQGDLARLRPAIPTRSATKTTLKAHTVSAHSFACSTSALSDLTHPW